MAFIFINHIDMTPDNMNSSLMLLKVTLLGRYCHVIVMLLSFSGKGNYHLFIYQLFWLITSAVLEIISHDELLIVYLSVNALSVM